MSHRSLRLPLCCALTSLPLCANTTCDDGAMLPSLGSEPIDVVPGAKPAALAGLTNIPTITSAAAKDAAAWLSAWGFRAALPSALVVASC